MTVSGQVLSADFSFHRHCGLGILNGSPATVIGAMIVAPLMTPILSNTTALVMGTMMLSVR